MRLLFLTSRLPCPPNRGDRLRTFHLLRLLGQEHELTLLSFVTSKAEAERGRELAAYCPDMHFIVRSKLRSTVTAFANIWRRQPLQALYYRSSEMQHRLDGLLASQKFDAAYVHLFRMAPYVEGKTDLYRIIDLTDMISLEIAESLPYRTAISRFIYRFELPRIVSYERQLAGWADETWLIGARDKNMLAEEQPAANLQVVPNGVDLARFYPDKQGSDTERLVFVGHLDVFHNIDAVNFLLDDILPLVRQKIPDTTLDIIGPGTGVTTTRGSPKGIRVRGFVPELNQALNQAAVFIAPLRFSAGVQNKVLEAMAAGLPVVTTGNVNAGLGARPDHDLLVGDTATELATAIITLLEDAPMRERIGKAGRGFVKQRFSWHVAVDRVACISSSRPV